MPNIDKHAPGAFTWIELSTSNQDAAKKFYTAVFGWTVVDNPMGPGAIYTMFQVEGRTVGAAYTQHGPEVEMGVPPHWNLYIDVASADETAKRAGELGGAAIAPPFDVFTYGRMAVIGDPQGAAFSIWEPKGHHGFEVRDQHASFCWADLNTSDPEAATKFYGALLGWTFTPGEGGYLHIKNGEAFTGGIPPAHHMPPGVPPHWMIYLQTDDCDMTVAKAKEAGAKICMGPVTMENIGRFAVLSDPQGAAFAVFTPMPRG
jgi:predicted enzyme related to lactoylglutathione lyase